MTLRAIQAAERRRQREEEKRRRELERRAKELAKVSALEQARLEVEAYENKIALLLSIHKEQGDLWNWKEVFASLAPLPPRRTSYHEFKARCASVTSQGSEAVIREACRRDERAFQDTLEAYAKERSEWEMLKALAGEILAGECDAHVKALTAFNPFEEIAELGSALHFTAHSPSLLECSIKVNGVQAVPAETKALTSAGKLSVKSMPRSQFHALYQDHLCSCVLRVGREVFAMLPVEECLINALADWFDSSSGRTSEQPVLSVVLSRALMADLDFERLDPSDAIERFLHRGDFKASRKAGAFAPIVPLVPGDIPRATTTARDLSQILAAACEFHRHIREEISKLDVMPSSAHPK